MKAIVIHKYKSIYWQIPKNGCSTIKHVIANLLHMKVPTHLQGQYDYAVHNLPFETIRDNGPAYDNYFQFAFVRHPIDRAISCWRNKIKSKPVTDKFFKDGVERLDLLRYNLFHAGMSFFDFATVISNIQLKDADPHFAPQHTLIPHKRHIHIYKFEKLNEGLTDVLKIIDAPSVKIPKLNASDHREEGYIPECLFKYYEKDFIIYSYSKTNNR